MVDVVDVLLLHLLAVGLAVGVVAPRPGLAGGYGLAVGVVVLPLSLCGVVAHRRSRLTVHNAQQCDSSVHQVAQPQPQAVLAHGNPDHASNALKVDVACLHQRTQGAEGAGAGREGVSKIGCWGRVPHVYRVCRRQRVEHCVPDLIGIAAGLVATNMSCRASEELTRRIHCIAEDGH